MIHGFTYSGCIPDITIADLASGGRSPFKSPGEVTQPYLSLRMQ